MKLFQISGAVPRSTGDGSSATFATVCAMGREGWSVQYAWPHSRRFPADPDFGRQLIDATKGRLELVPMPKRESLPDHITYAAGVARRLPRLWRYGLRALVPGQFTQAKWCATRLWIVWNEAPSYVKRWLRDQIAAFAPDAIQVDYPWMARYLHDEMVSQPKLFVAHEIQAQVVRQLAPDDRTLHRQVLQSEREALEPYDMVLALSPEDEAFLRQELRLSRVACSPLAVDTGTMTTPSGEFAASGSLRLTFLGGGRHPPNVDAVTWCRQEIMPAVRRKFANATLDIVGRYDATFMAANQGEGVAFRGYVDDAQAAIADSIFICPIRIGSGMRIKLLDAARAGVPIISTTIGARGLGFRAEEHFLAADSPAEFVDQIARLVAEPELGLRLATAAQTHIEAHFSPMAVAARRTEIIRGLLAARNA